MTLRVRPAVRLVSAVVLLAGSPVHANVSGNVDVQSQTTQNLASGADSSPSTLLMESLSLRYAGLPFGPSVLVATAGGALSNATGWMGNGVRTDGRVVSFDASVGFLPRRAVPLRLYTSGSLDAGTSGVLANHGAGPTLLYGGSLNLEPGALVPGLRLDAAERRSSRTAHPELSDVQRRLVASSYGTVARQRVNLGLRLEDEHRDGAGEVRSMGATLNVTSAPHQTTFLASEVRRSIANLAGITSDRTLSGNSDQRWSSVLTTQVGARYSEVAQEAPGAPAATGSIADARAAFTWVPLPGSHQLTLSGGGNAGRTRTSAVAGEGTGESRGATARAAYTQPLGRYTAGLSLGTSIDTCDCTFGNDGTTRLYEAAVSAGLPALGRGSAQADYTLVSALAPVGRGGDRLESHARASARLSVGLASAVHAGVSYDDAVRELLDITTGRAASLRERTVSGSLGAATGVGALSLSGDVRHTRGTLVTDGTPFVAGGARQARTSTSGQATVAWRARHDLGFQAQAIGTWTTLTDSTSVGSFGANAALNWRLGRITASVQYQAFRIELIGIESSFQHSVRTILSRPFDL